MIESQVGEMPLLHSVTSVTPRRSTHARATAGSVAAIAAWLSAMPAPLRWYGVAIT